MTFLNKVEALRERGLYNILFRNAGVGLLFYEGPYDEKGWPAEMYIDNDSRRPSNAWRQHLRVARYYETLEEAVEAEYSARMEAAASPEDLVQ